jgi:hypothetical protein
VVVTDKQDGARLSRIRVGRRFTEQDLRTAVDDSPRRPVAKPRRQRRAEVEPVEAQRAVGVFCSRRRAFRSPLFSVTAFFAGRAYTDEHRDVVERISRCRRREDVDTGLRLQTLARVYCGWRDPKGMPDRVYTSRKPKKKGGG